jgi:hypothetical protein
MNSPTLASIEVGFEINLLFLLRMAGRVDTVLWTLLKASDDYLPLKTYFTGAVITGYVFFRFGCPHCLRITDKTSYFASLLANAAIWPVSIFKIWRTGVPFIIRSKAESDRVEKERIATEEFIRQLRTHTPTEHEESAPWCWPIPMETPVCSNK